MTTDEAVLRARAPEDLTDCSVLLSRLTRLDAVGLVRLQQAGEFVTFWASPLEVVIRAEIRAQMNVGDRTMPAVELLAAVGAPAGGSVRLPPARDAGWRVTLPPRAGWSDLDVVPAEVVRDLADSAGRAVRAAADPVIAGGSLLDQEALRVSGGGDEVVLPVRVVIVLHRLGFLGAATAPAAVMRVACSPAWIRLAARHGTAYQRRNGLSLSRA